MKAVFQRVKSASVAIDGETVGKIGAGVMLLVGVRQGDTEQEAVAMAQKVANLRVFEDEAGKMNRSLLDIGGSALVISQFTLCADISHGRRPSFFDAAAPALAAPLYERVAAELRALGVPVETGRFGADMQVSLINDGPVTICMDTAEFM